jgi:hypothetical protein
MSSGYTAMFFAASKQRNSNSVQGIYMYKKFNSKVSGEWRKACKETQ